MWHRWWQVGCFLLALLLFGCKGMFGRQGLPPDPLFANRKAIESKVKLGPPMAPPFSEPAPAANPYFGGPQRGMGPSLRE